MTEDTAIRSEQTPVGDQIVVPGVQPITLRDRLMVRAAAPMTPKRNPHAQQKPCDVGLFDEVSCSQVDILDFLRAGTSGAASSNSSKED